MKTLYAAAVLCVFTFGFISCGPSAEEMKKDSITKDSIAHAMQDDGQRLIDSINQAMAKMSSSDTTKKDSAK